jgi:hypothetical protein
MSTGGRPSAVVHGRPLTGGQIASLQSCPRRQCGPRNYRAASERVDPITFRSANSDPFIDPTANQVHALRDGGPDRPVVMLNF